MNPLYQQMMPKGPQNNVMQDFMHFAQRLNSDPRQQVQQMLNSGRITQQQYDFAVQKANQFRQMMPPQIRQMLGL